MATPINTLKNWFKKGLKPLETQFAAWLDSYWHKDESIPMSGVSGLIDALNNTPSKAQVDALNTGKEDKINKGVANGYASLGDDGLVPSEQLPEMSGGTQNLSEVLTEGNDGSGAQIKNIGNPTDPQDADTLAARTAAINSAIEGLNSKSSVKARTTAALATNTLDATFQMLTASANGAFPNQDGVAIGLNDEILVVDEADQKKNGKYKLTQVGSVGAPWILTRTNDANTGDELNNSVIGVGQGTIHADTTWRQTTDSVVLGTSNIVFAPFGSATPVASETVSGKVEESTLAELNAGTGTGGSGARLFASPDKLSSSKYLDQSGSKLFAVASGTNTYTATFTPTVSAFTAGMQIVVQFTNASTSTAPTLNGMTIVKRNNTALVSGDIAAGQIYVFVCDGTNLRMIGIANTGVLLDLLLTNQAATSGKKNPVHVDDTGKINKTNWVEHDTTNRKTTSTGIDNLMSTVLEDWKNSDGVPIMEIVNGLRVRFGGTSAIWEINDGVSSDNAAIKSNDNQAKSLKFTNKNGDEMIVLRTTTGSLGVIFRQVVEYDFSQGFKKIHVQSFFITDTTAAAWNNIFAIALAADQSVTINVNHLHAYATDRSVAFAYGNMQGYARRDNSNVTDGTNPAFTINGDGITGVNWRIIANNTTEAVNIDFQNNSGTGKTWHVALDLTYILRALPV